MAMSRYNWKMKDGLLPYREILPNFVCKIIGLQCYTLTEHIETGRYYAWQKQNKLKIILEAN